MALSHKATGINILGHFDSWRWDHYAFSKLWARITQWRRARSLKNGYPKLKTFTLELTGTCQYSVQNHSSPRQIIRNVFKIHLPHFNSILYVCEICSVMPRDSHLLSSAGYWQEYLDLSGRKSLGRKNFTVRILRICSRRIIKVNRLRRLGWTEESSAHGDMRDYYIFLIGVPMTDRPLGRHKRGWEDNIKIYGKGTGSVAVHRIICGWGHWSRLWNFEFCRSFINNWVTVGFSKWTRLNIH